MSPSSRARKKIILRLYFAEILYYRALLPQQLAKFVRQKRVQCYTKQLKAEGKTAGKGAWNPNAWPLLNTNEFEQCCRRAFNGTNKMSHEENEVSKNDDCEYSE